MFLILQYFLHGQIEVMLPVWQGFWLLRLNACFLIVGFHLLYLAGFSLPRAFRCTLLFCQIQ